MVLRILFLRNSSHVLTDLACNDIPGQIIVTFQILWVSKMCMSEPPFGGEKKVLAVRYLCVITLLKFTKGVGEATYYKSPIQASI